MILITRELAELGSMRPGVFILIYYCSTGTFPAHLDAGWRVIAPGRLYSGSTKG